MTVTERRRRLTREQQKAQTRERLLASAEEVFKEGGLAAASVEEITERAGYSRGAFYSNFDSKEEMFVELLQRRAYEEYTRMLERTPGAMTPREQLRWGAEELVDRYSRSDEDEGGQWLAALWLEFLALAARKDEFREMAAGFWRANRQVVAGRIREEYARRGAELPVDATYISAAMTALDVGLFLQHLVDPGEVPLEAYPPLYEALFGDLVEPEPE